MPICPHVVRGGGYSVLQPRRHLVAAAAIPQVHRCLGYLKRATEQIAKSQQLDHVLLQYVSSRLGHINLPTTTSGTSISGLVKVASDLSEAPGAPYIEYVHAKDASQLMIVCIDRDSKPVNTQATNLSLLGKTVEIRGDVIVGNSSELN
jgi:hypothetical protein